MESEYTGDGLLLFQNFIMRLARLERGCFSLLVDHQVFLVFALGANFTVRLLNQNLDSYRHFRPSCSFLSEIRGHSDSAKAVKLQQTQKLLETKGRKRRKPSSPV